MIRPRRFAFVLVLISLAILAGCSGPSRKSGGGYYKDDGPGSHIPANIEAIPDAVPRLETHAKANLRPYTVFGQRYVPVSDRQSFRQQGTASWYGRKFHGSKTANGETYDMYSMTAAHPTLPIPSYARVTHAGTGKSVIVRVNDRGPFHSSRVIDLSYVAAAKLGLIGPGSGQVIIEAITNDDIQKNTYAKAAPPAIAPARPADTPALATAPRSLQLAQPPAAVPNALDALQAATISDDGTNDHIYLQFGAFSAMQSADNLVQKINSQIGRLESRAAHVASVDELHRVQIGPYPSRTAAINAALRIQQETGLHGAVAIR